jgi:hypothetical protein
MEFTHTETSMKLIESLVLKYYLRSHCKQVIFTPDAAVTKPIVGHLHHDIKHFLLLWAVPNALIGFVTWPIKITVNVRFNNPTWLEKLSHVIQVGFDGDWIETLECYVLM